MGADSKDIQQKDAPTTRPQRLNQTSQKAPASTTILAIAADRKGTPLKDAPSSQPQVSFVNIATAQDTPPVVAEVFQNATKKRRRTTLLRRRTDT